MESLLEIAKKAAYEAGAVVMELYGDTESTKKADGSPVTLADMRSHHIITEHLSKTSIPILSEESTGVTPPYPERLWIIDPIDGTKGFIARDDEFAIMIGLLENGVPTLGVVYAPAQGILYFAEKGMGAFKETSEGTTQMTVSAEPHTPIRFLRSRNHFTPFMEKVAETLSATLIPSGSIGLKAAQIGHNEGEFFFFNTHNLGEWDVCAPLIILEEAGGKASDCFGNTLSFGSTNNRMRNGIVFSHPSCHAEIIKTLSMESVEKEMKD